MSSRSRLFLASAVALVFLLPPVVLGAWAFWLEPASLRTAQYRLALPHWPAACSGLRVAVLADLHVGSAWNGLDNLARVTAAVRAAKPDLVLLAGDYVLLGTRVGKFVAPEEIAPRLARLTAPLGRYAVLGNHDWWVDGPRVRRALEANDTPVLEDSWTGLATALASMTLAAPLALAQPVDLFGGALSVTYLQSGDVGGLEANSLYCGFVDDGVQFFVTRGVVEFNLSQLPADAPLSRIELALYQLWTR